MYIYIYVYIYGKFLNKNGKFEKIHGKSPETNDASGLRGRGKVENNDALALSAGTRSTATTRRVHMGHGQLQEIHGESDGKSLVISLVAGWEMFCLISIVNGYDVR